MSDGNEEAELRGCKAIAGWGAVGVALWLAAIGGVIWLAS
jgi:hypothetical protein